jgi:hypothetical protein
MTMVVFGAKHFAHVERPGIGIVKTALEMTSSVNERKQMRTLTLRIRLIFTELPRLMTLSGIGGGGDPRQEDDLAALQLRLAKRWGKHVYPSSQRHALSTLKSVSGFMFITHIHVLQCPSYADDRFVRILGRDVPVVFSAPSKRGVRNIVHAEFFDFLHTPEVVVAATIQSPESMPTSHAERPDDLTWDPGDDDHDDDEDRDDDDRHESLCSCGVSSGVAVRLSRCIPTSFHEPHCTVQVRPRESSESFESSEPSEPSEQPELPCVVLRTFRSTPSALVMDGDGGEHATDHSTWTPFEWSTMTLTRDVQLDARKLMLPNATLCTHAPLYERCAMWIRRVARRPQSYVWTFHQGAVFNIVGTLGDNWILSPTRCESCGDEQIAFGQSVCEPCALMWKIDAAPLMVATVHPFYLFPMSLAASSGPQCNVPLIRGG